LTRGLAAAGVIVSLVLGSCDAPSSSGPRYLSEWDLFTDPANQVPAPGVVPYEINAPLFSDYASKHRFIRVPEGETITIGADGDWSFPEGTVIAKTFGFYVDARDPSLGEQLIETRLLVREGGVWEPYVYRWNAEETDAERMPAGGRVSVSFLDVAGRSRAIEYRVPNVNQCTNCHGGTLPIDTLGPRTDQMDHLFDYGSGLENQIDHMASLGLFSAPPPPAAEPRRRSTRARGPTCTPTAPTATATAAGPTSRACGSASRSPSRCASGSASRPPRPGRAPAGAGSTSGRAARTCRS
jgi:hypothetical protein